MFEAVRRFWKDPVWSSVVAGLIVAGSLSGGATALGWWPVVVSGIESAWVSIISDVAVPAWLLLVMVAACMKVSWELATWWDRLGKRPYEHDVIEGVKWRWDARHGSPEEVVDVTPYCPTCDMQVVPEVKAEGYGDSRTVRSTYCCDGCGTKLGRFEDDPTYKSRVVRHIERNLRNGRR